ncbi:hypothetical protein PR048_031759 [Dryococelus australis]|uniref:Uncharacterized protein n=1 Tax=Dryococelus australis TaxID=614101 RepID=A0ABQ9G665_9NEOP|nr:hypothetical protein PR048_031759 [Dryococelus australis]
MYPEHSTPVVGELPLCRRTFLSQLLPEDYNYRVTKVLPPFCDLRKASEYIPSQIGKADPIPGYFDMPQNKIVNGKEGNLHCTVMLAVTADGQDLLPYIIFKWMTMPKRC